MEGLGLVLDAAKKIEAEKADIEIKVVASEEQLGKKKRLQKLSEKICTLCFCPKTDHERSLRVQIWMIHGGFLAIDVAVSSMLAFNVFVYTLATEKDSGVLAFVTTFLGACLVASVVGHVMMGASLCARVERLTEER